jgi:hypothetical protein
VVPVVFQVRVAMLHPFHEDYYFALDQAQGSQKCSGFAGSLFTNTWALVKCRHGNTSFWLLPAKIEPQASCSTSSECLL